MTVELIEPAQQAQQAQAGALMAQPPQRGDIVGAGAMPQQRQPSVIEAAIKVGASAAELREILALQRDLDNHQLALMRERRAMDEEDRKRAAELAFARDFAAFRGENVIIPKSKFVDRGRAGSFMQADYGTAAAMLSPALSRHGFSFRHDMKFAQREWKADGSNPDIPAGTPIFVPWVYVTTHLTHRDGHTESLDLDGPPGDATANTPVQNMQVTGSFLKRQGLLSITGTATQDEDDENQQGNRRRPAASQQGQDAAAPDDTLLDAGRAEAMKGMKALTAWWGALTAKQRSALNNDFGGLRKCATRVDQENPQ